MNEIRLENEKLKDKIIVFELDNIGHQSQHMTQDNTKPYNNKINTTVFSNNVMSYINDRTLADSKADMSNQNYMSYNHYNQRNQTHQMENSFGTAQTQNMHLQNST